MANYAINGRKYQAIWDKLKLKKECKIEVPPTYSERVKKAVIKEKDKDRIFKLEEDIKGNVWRLETVYSRETNVMSFRLVNRWDV